MMRVRHVEESGPPDLFMSPDTTAAWRTRGREVLGFVLAAERRLSVSLRLNDVTMLAAADELSAATKVATAWLTANPCPDSGLGVQMARMLNNCAEVAFDGSTGRDGAPVEHRGGEEPHRKPRRRNQNRRCEDARGVVGEF